MEVTHLGSKKIISIVENLIQTTLTNNNLYSFLVTNESKSIKLNIIHHSFCRKNFLAENYIFVLRLLEYTNQLRNDRNEKT